MGGPRRELVRLLMRSLITESGVLTGSEKRKIFSSSPLLVAQKTYFHAGRMVATSVLQRGPGLKCLAPAVYAYLLADVDKCRRLVKCFVFVEVFCICGSVLYLQVFCICASVLYLWKCSVFVQVFCICASVLYLCKCCAFVQVFCICASVFYLCECFLFVRVFSICASVL